MPDTPLLRLCVRVLTALSAVAPAWRQDDWRAEWIGELHFRASRLAAHGRLTRVVQLRLLARCASGIFHVLFLWRHEWMFDTASHDVRLALRLVGRRPGMSIVAIVTVALGVGATTAMFSVVRAVLLRPLPYPEPGRIVRVDALDSRDGQQRLGNVSLPDADDFQRFGASLDALGVYNAGYSTLTGAGAPERVPRLSVTSGYFRALGIRPLLGRLFTAADDRESAPPLVVISSGLWQRQFGANPAVIGRAITLGGEGATIVGVLGPDFVHPDPEQAGAPDIFTLLDHDLDQSPRSGRFLHGIARLKSGRTVAQADAELQAVAARLARAYPDSNTGESVVVRPLAEVVSGNARLPLILLQIATLAVLLIGCANLANLFLGAAAGRGDELAVRTALGAGRTRIVRQLVTESLILSGIGGIVGMVLARGATAWLSRTAAPLLLAGQTIAVDTPVLLFALATTVAAGLLFGLVPALHVSGTAAVRLRAGRRSTDGPSQHRLRSVLIAGEVALSVTLLIGAVLLVRSFDRLTRVDPGFQASHVLSFDLAIPITRYPEGTEAGFYDRLYGRLRSLPGVGSVGSTDVLPFSGDYSCDGIRIPEHPVSEGEQPCAEARSIGGDYFRTMGVPLVRGRLFGARDGVQSPHVIIVNEAFARQFFAGEDPLGRQVVYEGRRQRDARRIVGIVGNVRHFGLASAAPPEFYTPQPQPPSFHAMTVVMRIEGTPTTLMPAVRAEVRALDPEVPIYNVRTLSELVDASVSDVRFRTRLLTLFAGLALLLAVIGTYGVVSLVVAQQTPEMGVRIALGAARVDIVRLILVGGLRPVVIGIAIGLASGAAAGKTVAALLFHVRPIDPITFGAAAAAMLGAATAAAWLPARRACRVDPAIALRHP